LRIDKRVSLAKLEILVLVADLGGVGRAAEHLYVSQPVVTAHIRTLERQIGARLLARDGRTVRLTEAGQAAYAWAKETLSRSRELDRTIAGLAGGLSGTAVLAGSMTVGCYLLPPILADFSIDHPDAHVTLQVLAPDHVWDAVQEGSCDIGVAIAPRLQHDRAISGRQVGTERLIAVTRPGGHAAGHAMSIADFARLPFVSTPAGTIRRSLEEEMFLAHGITRGRPTIECGHPHAIKTAVRRGLGVAMLLHSSAADDLAAGTLAEVTLIGADQVYPIFAAWRRSKRLTPLQLALIEEIEQACRDHADSSGAGRCPGSPESHTWPR
jgi:DNA-binding transcriptional LysR family regulator